MHTLPVSPQREGARGGSGLVAEVGQALGYGVRAVGASPRRSTPGEGVPCRRQDGAHMAQGSSADAGHPAALRMLVAGGNVGTLGVPTGRACRLLTHRQAYHEPAIQTVRPRLFLVSTDALQGSTELSL